MQRSPSRSALVVLLFLLLLAQAVDASQALPTVNAWPVFQHDAQHSGRETRIGSQTSQTFWNFATEGMPGSPVVASDGTIYLPVGELDTNTTGFLYAIDPDGSQKWRLELDMLPSATAAAIGANGNIYVHGNGKENNLSAVEKLVAITANGVLSWTYKFNSGIVTTTSYVQSAPVIGSDGTIYVGSQDTNLYALNPDGTVKWARSPTLTSIAASPALSPDEQTVYIVDSTTTLHAYSNLGFWKWSIPLATPEMTTANIQSPAVGSDGTIYVGSPDQWFYAISATGDRKWRFETGATIYSSPAIGADGTIYFAADGLYALRADGTQKWRFGTMAFSSASPIIGGDGLLYWRADFTAYAIKADGNEQWHVGVEPFSVSSLEPSAAIGTDGAVYLATAKFIGGQNGLRALQPPPPAPTASPTPTATATAIPVATATPTATGTPIAGTATATPGSTATKTPLAATATATTAATATQTATFDKQSIYLPVVQR